MGSQSADGNPMWRDGRQSRSFRRLDRFSDGVPLSRFAVQIRSPERRIVTTRLPRLASVQLSRQKSSNMRLQRSRMSPKCAKGKVKSFVAFCQPAEQTPHATALYHPRPAIRCATDFQCPSLRDRGVQREKLWPAQSLRHRLHTSLCPGQHPPRS